MCNSTVPGLLCWGRGAARYRRAGSNGGAWSAQGPEGPRERLQRERRLLVTHSVAGVSLWQNGYRATGTCRWPPACHCRACGGGGAVRSAPSESLCKLVRLGRSPGEAQRSGVAACRAGCESGACGAPGRIGGLACGPGGTGDRLHAAKQAWPHSPCLFAPVPPRPRSWPHLMSSRSLAVLPVTFWGSGGAGQKQAAAR
jgi:hypothetical protein